MSQFPFFIWVILTFFYQPAATVVAQAVDEASFPTEQVTLELKTRLEAKAPADGLRIGQRRLLHAPGRLLQLYQGRNFAPRWTTAAQVETAVRLLLAADREGLLSHDYHVEAILRLKGQTFNPGATPTAAALADLELLLTDALAAYGTHLAHGKVIPKEIMPEWNYTQLPSPADSLAILQKIAATDSLENTLEMFKPGSTSYKLVRERLAFYRDLAAKGGWPRLEPDSAKLGKGKTAPRVRALRQRLAVEGFLASRSDTLLFDDTLEVALKAYQKTYGLRQTGLLDENTTKALNVPLADRINTLRINLEKARWLPDTLPAHLVMVNVPSFHLYYFRENQVVWHTDVTTGKPENQTPIFTTQIKGIEFNPTWGVPGGILRNEVLPAVMRNPNYLRRNRMALVSRSGQVVDPSTIDWANYRGGHSFVQAAGRGNQLGRIKFLCPNKYSIYLHDTPHKSGFKYMDRAFSHGCVRVWEPFKLAEKIFADTTQWNQTVFDTLVKKGATKRVPIDPLDVYIVYFTAGADPVDGSFFLRKDAYGLDQKALSHLNMSAATMQADLARQKREAREQALAKRKAAQEAAKAVAETKAQTAKAEAQAKTGQ
ncbi:MAG: L,D-transpeptidase family protein [Bernardetiaceae bacterium]|jgi:murein L,D-transpeptidase YcbB/YkuD|nr:L,D-transpeptidase family protein [Bernardetiaceae bacterium]